jgi:hypothetical protein
MKENIYTDKKMNILVNKVGLSKDIAQKCYNKSKKYCVWIGNQVLKSPDIINKENDIDLVLDWKKEIQDINLNSINFKTALKLAKDYQKSLFVPNVNGLKNTNVVLDCGDYKWVQLITKADCKEEGSTMGHCIGNNGHNTRISNGNSVAFSLRDKFNRPHITIEADIKDNKIGNIFEFKGTANGVPKVEYSKYFIQLLEKYSFKGVSDSQFFSSIQNSLSLIEEIDEINKGFLPFDFKLKFGISPFREGEFYLDELLVSSDNKVSIPKNTSFYSNLTLNFDKEIILEGDILIGGNLIITSKKIIIGENIKVGGNVFISSSKPVENKENIISFGKKEFKNIKIL